MYTPKHFNLSDFDETTNFILNHSFGVLVSEVDKQQPFATHVPFFYDVEKHLLLAHLARANPQWQNLNGQTVMVIFSGPHAYISPAWYDKPSSVPTWNYVAVHVYGKCTLIHEEERVADMLERLVTFYEPDSDLPAQGNEPFYRNLMKGIVGFQIDITRVEGKAKLSQDKSVDVQQRIVSHLLQGNSGAQGIARLMQKRLNSPERSVFG